MLACCLFGKVKGESRSKPFHIAEGLLFRAQQHVLRSGVKALDIGNKKLGSRGGLLHGTWARLQLPHLR